MSYTRLLSAFMSFFTIALLLAACGGGNEIGSTTNPIAEETNSGGNNAASDLVTRVIDMPYNQCNTAHEVTFVRPLSNNLVVKFDLLDHLVTLTNDPVDEITGNYTIDIIMKVFRHVTVSEINNEAHFITQTHEISNEMHIAGSGSSQRTDEFPHADDSHVFTLPLQSLAGSHLKLRVNFSDWASVSNYSWTGIETLNDYCAGRVEYTEGNEDSIVGPVDPNQGEY